MRCLLRNLTIILPALLVVGCITPREKRDMQNDLFNVQTRLLSLERNLSDTSKDAKSTGDSASRRLASTQTELERLQHEMQQVRGELESLRIGVTTGQMPGRERDPNSLAGQLARLSERLESIEQTQEDLLDALKKAGLNRPKKSPGKKIANVSDLQRAFDEKQFKVVTEEGSRLTSAGSTSDREKARFLVAEGFFKLGKMREAALKYSELLDGNPNPKLIPTAKLRLGDSFRHLGDKSTAQIYYEEIIKEYPDSEEAKKAKEHLGGDDDKSSDRGEERG